MQTQIDNAFAELDALMLSRQTDWALARQAAIIDYRETECYRELGTEAYYAGLFAVAGGKTWYNALDGSDAEKVVEKNVKKLIAKRNDKIIAKLTAKGITDLPEFELTHSSDGYEGVFLIGDTARVTIQTVLAGGYNIQCLHARTLVNIV